MPGPIVRRSMHRCPAISPACERLWSCARVQSEHHKVPGDGVGQLRPFPYDWQQRTLTDIHERGLLQKPSVDAVEHQLRADHQIH